MYIKEIDKILSHYFCNNNVQIQPVPTKRNEYKTVLTKTYEGFQQSYKSLTKDKFPLCYEEEVLKRIKQVLTWRQQLQTLQQYPLIQQKTDEWYKLRQDRLTASEFAQALGFGKFGKPIDTVLKKSYNIEQEFYAPATQWGNKYEDTAIKIYEHLYHTKVYEFGMMPNDIHQFFGASPDGINELGIMVEIKCPFKRKLKKIPSIIEQYYYQIQGQLNTCKLENCDYFECYFMEYQDRTKFFKELQTQSQYSNGDYVGNQVFFGIIVQKHFNKETHSPDDFPLEELYPMRSPAHFQYNELLEWETKNIDYDISYYNDEQLEEDFDNTIIHSNQNLYKQQEDEDAKLLQQLFKKSKPSNDQQQIQTIQTTQINQKPKREFQYKIIYWKCYKYHLENVEYNKKFFEQRINQLGEVWEQIKNYRDYHKTNNQIHPDHQELVQKQLQKKLQKMEKTTIDEIVDMEIENNQTK